MAKLEILTDDAIIDYTSDPDGRQRVLTDHRDLNLSYKLLPIFPYDGGVYDVSIFGSPYSDRCICGNIRTVSSEPCPNCGARVLSTEDSLRRFARIELPFYYLSDLRFDIFREFFDDTFKDSAITYNFANPDLRVGGYSERGAKRPGIKVFDSCQFNYNKKTKELVISEFIDDEAKCSYEGIMAIIKEHFPSRLRDYMRLINRLYLVEPAILRPFAVAMKRGKSMVVPDISTWYEILIRLCCVEDTEAGTQNYKSVIEKFTTPGARVRYTALLRALINMGKKEASSLLNTSSENLARGLYTVRAKNSARCPIIPDTKLAMDEVSIPKHIAYELLRADFCEYLQTELNFTKEQAVKSTKKEYDNPELQKRFKEFAEKQVVID